MILNYGQYKGQDIADVPEAYLQWLMTSAQETIDNVRAELERRKTETDVDLANLDGMNEKELRQTVLRMARQMKREGLA